jgi:hypothetical protein
MFMYITNQFQTTFAPGGGGVKSFSRGDCEEQRGKLQDFCPNYVQEFSIWRRTTVHTVPKPIHNVGYMSRVLVLMKPNYEYPWKHRKNEDNKYLESLTVNIINIVLPVYLTSTILSWGPQSL